MTCRTIQRWLAAYVGNELTPRRAAAVQTHLERCPACRGEHDSLREAMAALHRAAAPLPEDEAIPAKMIWQGVERRLRARTDRRRRVASLLLKRPLPVAAATAFLALLAVVLGFMIRPLDDAPTASEIVKATRDDGGHVRSAFLGPPGRYRAVQPPPFALENVPRYEIAGNAHHLPGISQRDERPGEAFVLEQVTYEPGAPRRMEF